MKAKTRQRKLPVTSQPKSKSSSGSSASRQTTANLIRRFHVLIKRRTQLEKRKESAENARALRDVEEEIQQMGGLEAYQKMSSIGQGEDRGGGSEKVLVGWLKDLGVQKEMNEKRGKLRLLEVGALKPDNYAHWDGWIDNRPIDLRSRHPSIQEQDFLLMDQDSRRAHWDVISLSLVVNFVPDPRDRGRMLRFAHNMLRVGGFLFLALPLPCVANSRYLTFEHLASLMRAIGFEQTRERWKAGGKMAYWLYRKQPAVHSATQALTAGLDHPTQRRQRSGREPAPELTRSDSSEPTTSAELGRIRGEEREGRAVPFDKKVVLREGKRNNFCILL